MLDLTDIVVDLFENINIDETWETLRRAYRLLRKKSHCHHSHY
jgi:hypothetical protein